MKEGRTESEGRKDGRKVKTTEGKIKMKKERTQKGRIRQHVTSTTKHY